MSVHKTPNGESRWNSNGIDDRSQNVKDFLAEIVEAGKKRGLSLSHEDTHGAFVVEPFSDTYAEWLLDACEEIHNK